MDDSDNGFAYRCLPLLLANQSGWVILNPARISVQWNGGSAKDDIVIMHSDSRDRQIATSHFGTGIITFSIPYLFRTPENVNLWVRGAANWPLDGVCPLEGIVEADWTAATFTMNWKITRPNVAVTFEPGMPICMLVPIHRELSETLIPRIKEITDNPELASQYAEWSKRRTDFNQRLASGEPKAVARKWERDYFKGLNLNGGKFRSHQTGVKLKPFS